MGQTINLAELFGDNVPQGVDIEKLNSALGEKVNAVIEENVSGVRSAEQKNQKALQDELEVLKAELEDVRSGKSGSTGNTPSTEAGSRAAAVRAEQAKRQQEEAAKQSVAQAVQKRDAWWNAKLEADKLGVPATVIERAGDDPERLGDLTALYVAMNPNADGKEKKEPDGSGPLNPSTGGGGAPSDDNQDTMSRVLSLTRKLPDGMSGGRAHSIAEGL